MACRFNTFRPRQNGRHFADDIFQEHFVPKDPVNNIPALVQAITWTNDDCFTDAYLKLKLKLFLFSNNNHYSWKIFIDVMQDL